MFEANNANESNNNKIKSQNILDPFTIWLIRIACLTIILFLSGILLGIPIFLSIAKGQINHLLNDYKDVLRNLIDNYLS